MRRCEITHRQPKLMMRNLQNGGQVWAACDLLHFFIRTSWAEAEFS